MFHSTHPHGVLPKLNLYNSNFHAKTPAASRYKHKKIIKTAISKRSEPSSPLTHKNPHRERENGSERPETAQRPKSAIIALITFILTVDASDLS